MGEGGGHRQSVLGEQGGGTAEGRQLPRRAGQPERRGQTALPDGPAVKGRSTPARFPARFPASGECTSHLGLGLETTGSDQAFQDVRYWEPNQSLEEILLRKIFLNIHLELLHGLSEILISHRRPMETVDDRVERAIKDAILQFRDRWYESESIREYPVGSYNHWLTRHRNFKDALLEAVKEGFEIGDAIACKSMRTAYEQLLESKDPAVRYFANSLEVLPKQPREAIPEVEWLDQDEHRKGRVRTPGGADLGVVEKYVDGIWYVTRFEGGPPKPPAKAMTQTDAMCYLAATMTRPAQVTADGVERNLRIVEGFHSDFRQAHVKVNPRDPAMNKVTFWDNNHGLEVGQQVLGSVDICICNRCAGPFHVIPSAGKH